MRGFSLGDEKVLERVCVGDCTAVVFLTPPSYIPENGWDGKLHGTSILWALHMLAFGCYGKIIAKGAQNEGNLIPGLWL